MKKISAERKNGDGSLTSRVWRCNPLIYFERKERGLKLLVVVMFLGLNYKHRDAVVVDVVYDAVVGCDVA